MDIIPTDTMRNIDDIRREIDRVYRLPYTFFQENSSPDLSLPFTDLYETDEQIIVSCDLPGLQNKNVSFEEVKVVYKNGVLKVYFSKETNKL